MRTIRGGERRIRGEKREGGEGGGSHEQTAADKRVGGETGIRKWLSEPSEL